MIKSLGLAIQRAARFILRITLGLRVPAARVRVHDQKSRHDYAREQLALAQTQVFLWEREADAADGGEVVHGAHPRLNWTCRRWPVGRKQMCHFGALTNLTTL